MSLIEKLKKGIRELESSKATLSLTVHFISDELERFKKLLKIEERKNS